VRLKPDCRHFPGDRPCRFHKESGICCPECPHYAPITQKILIVKLGAMGDVLRTTALLHPLKKKYPESHITWLTLTPSLDFFAGNGLVDAVLDYRFDALPRLWAEEYDLILNPDAEKLSAALASAARGKEKLGFGLDRHGAVIAFNPEAERWLEMGAFDDLKRANKSTYQEIILGLCRLPHNAHPIMLSLSAQEREIGIRFAQAHGLSPEARTVGLYTGAGERWERKTWTEEGFRDLITTLLAETPYQVLLYGGPDAEARNYRLLAEFASSGHVVSTGTNNPLRTFFALLSLSDLIVTGDTMALHAGLALGKKVVGLFGPTSSAEIEMYGQGTKLTGTVECLCCYRPTCTVTPTCMDTITPKMVVDAITDLLK